jgi:WD40 repeat protein
MALHPSGRILTVATGKGFVERIDTATGQTLWRHAIDPAGFETCALSKSGAWLACAQGTKLEVFDTVTGTRLTSIDDRSFYDATDYEAELRPYVFDYDDDESGPDDRQTRIKDIALSDDGKATPIFERPTPKKLVFLPPQRSFPSMIARGKTVIAVGQYEGSVAIFSEEGELLRSLPAPANGRHREILSVAISADDEVAVGRYDRSIEAFGAKSGEPRVVVESGTSSIIGVRALAWSPDGSLLVGLGDDGIGRWVRKDGSKGTFAENDGAACLAISFQPSGAFFATSSCSGDARIWRAKDPKELQRFPKQGRPAALAYSPSGDVLAVAADDTLQSLPIGRTIGRVPSDSIRAIAWLDDDRVAAGSMDGNVYVFDARSFGPARTVLDGHSSGIESIVSLSPQVLVTGARDGLVARWALEKIEAHGSFTQALRETLRAYA